MLDDHLQIVTFSELPRSLEQVYLEGISRDDQEGANAE
jgi:hypothetical protein